VSKILPRLNCKTFVVRKQIQFSGKQQGSNKKIQVKFNYSHHKYPLATVESKLTWKGVATRQKITVSCVLDKLYGYFNLFLKKTKIVKVIYYLRVFNWQLSLLFTDKYRNNFIYIPINIINLSLKICALYIFLFFNYIHFFFNFVILIALFTNLLMVLFVIFLS